MGDTLLTNEACGSCGTRVLRVFQGAVGAFLASTAPAASIGRVRCSYPRMIAVTFVEPSQQDSTEVNRPDAIVHFLEADGVLLQRVADEEQARLEPERSGVRDALHEEVSGILDGRQRSGVRAGRRPIARRGRGPSQELVRPLLVVLGAEAIERALLGRRASRGAAESPPP